MGWTSVFVGELVWDGAKKNYDRKEFLDRHMNCENDMFKWELLKSSMIGSTWYGAVKRTKIETGEFVVYGETILTAIENHEFYYKEVSEDMGPYTLDCPIGILKLLTPTDNNYAKQWREKCEANHRLKTIKNGLWTKAQNKSKVNYLRYTLPYDLKSKVSGYKAGDEVILSYGSYMVKGKLTRCWSDGLFRFKKKDIDIFKCTFMCQDGTTFVPVMPVELGNIINQEYIRD